MSKTVILSTTYCNAEDVITVSISLKDDPKEIFAFEIHSDAVKACDKYRDDTTAFLSLPVTSNVDLMTRCVSALIHASTDETPIMMMLDEPIELTMH